jgi:hypothetical protein
MANNLIEDSELTALANNPNHCKSCGNYIDFIGIGEGRQKAKKAGATAISANAPDEGWKYNLRMAYSLIKGNNVATSVALTNLNKSENDQNIYLATKDFGIPNTKKNIDTHNGVVKTYIKYNYAGIDSYAKDCNNLNRLIKSVDFDAEAANKRLGVDGSDENKGEAQALASIQAKLKKMDAEAKCTEAVEAAEQQKSKEEILETIKAGTSVGASSKDNIVKYFAYGLGGLIVLTAIILLIKNR